MCVFAGIVPFPGFSFELFHFISPDARVNGASVLIKDQERPDVSLVVITDDVIASYVQVLEHIIFIVTPPDGIIVAMNDVGEEIFFGLEGLEDLEISVAETIQRIGIDIRNLIHSNYFLSI